MFVYVLQVTDLCVCMYMLYRGYVYVYNVGYVWLASNYSSKY